MISSASGMMISLPVSSRRTRLGWLPISMDTFSNALCCRSRHVRAVHLANAGGNAGGKAGGKGPFQGFCSHCGMWGHRFRECPLKDAEMAAWRAHMAAGSYELSPGEEEWEEEGQEEQEDGCLRQPPLIILSHKFQYLYFLILQIYSMDSKFSHPLDQTSQHVCDQMFLSLYLVH